MSVSFLISQAKSVQKVINENSAEIEVLDQKIGDGDHIFNIQRGLKLVVELEDAIKDLPLAKALNMIAMKERGKADVGEKTMMDVLIPVSEKLNELKNESEFKSGLNEVIKIAEERMLSTKDMLATKGRASFLGERAKGHIDPGARSSQLIIDTICKSVINN